MKYKFQQSLCKKNEKSSCNIVFITKVIKDKKMIKRQDTYDETFPLFDNFQNTCTCQMFEMKLNFFVLK